MSYQIRRVDENQKAIVNTFRQLGATVLILSNVGNGCPDILVGYHGKNYLFEIKDGSKVPSARKLTRHEALFHQKWQGHVAIVETIEEAQHFIFNHSR